MDGVSNESATIEADKLRDMFDGFVNLGNRLLRKP
jgi:hypothetical protein